MSIVFTDFSFRYSSQEKPTLKNINLKINTGEKVLIIGASGSGKSTLGQCVNGLIPHAIKGEISGKLRIQDADVEGFTMHDYSEKIGTVLQDTDDQFVGLSIGEDIAFSLENQMTSNIDMYPLVKATAKMVALEDMLTRSPEALSGGQKQRVSLAGILVNQVDILLFDEPLAALDPKTSQKTIEIIDDLHKKTNKTIVIIEHRLEEVLHRHIDRIILMDKGEIIADTTPSRLLHSDLLEQYGIREPLYLSALKTAGCRIDSQIALSNFAALAIEPYQPILSDWLDKQVANKADIKQSSFLGMHELSYSYDGEKKALDKINIDIAAGEFVAILGKNGSGKSTLSKLLMGILRPDSGELLLQGEDLSQYSLFERSDKIGVVLQNPNHMISHHLIYDEIAFGLRNRGVSEQEIAEKVQRVLALCGLSQYKHWPIEALSYGQKKRVTIAAILVLEPQILVLDEPSAGQDKRNFTAMLSFIESLNQQLGITVIVISHDLHLALEYCQRALVLCDGKLLADAPVSELFSQPQLLAKANLTTTSLFELAKSAKLPTQAFIQHYVGLTKNVADTINQQPSHIKR